MNTQYNNMNRNEINKSIANFNLRILMIGGGPESGPATFHLAKMRPTYAKIRKLPKFLAVPLDTVLTAIQFDSLFSKSYLCSGYYTDVVEHLEKMNLPAKYKNFCKPI